MLGRVLSALLAPYPPPLRRWVPTHRKEEGRAPFPRVYFARALAFASMALFRALAFAATAASRSVLALAAAAALSASAFCFAASASSSAFCFAAAASARALACPGAADEIMRSTVESLAGVIR